MEAWFRDSGEVVGQSWLLGFCFGLQCIICKLNSQHLDFTVNLLSVVYFLFLTACYCLILLIRQYYVHFSPWH